MRSLCGFDETLLDLHVLLCEPNKYLHVHTSVHVAQSLLSWRCRCTVSSTEQNNAHLQCVCVCACVCA